MKKHHITVLDNMFFFNDTTMGGYCLLFGLAGDEEEYSLLLFSIEELRCNPEQLRKLQDTCYC